MTKKDYIKAAAIVSRLDNKTHQIVACMAFCALFRDDNPLYNEGRFIKACGVMRGNNPAAK